MKKRGQTKQERFLIRHGIRPIDLWAATGYSRQHLLRIRQGTQEPTRRCITAITDACRRLSATKLTALDLFDLGSKLGHSKKE